MPSEWSNLREIFLDDLHPGQPGVGRRLETALREAVRSGRLPVGERLPSSRDLAGQLGLARGTVAAAYDQLTAEGLLVGRRGAGTTVARAGTVDQAPPADSGSAPPTYRIDLYPGRPHLAGFPREAWTRATKEAMRTLPESDFGYGDPRGLLSLRRTLLSYLARVRGVMSSVDDLVIISGAAQGMALSTRMLRQLGHTEIAVEDPGHTESVHTLGASGIRVVAVPTDEHGIVVEELRRLPARAVMVTPAHQAPLGVPLTPDRRRDLLAWAAERDGLIVEDDYDAEYRYDRAAIGALQPLAPDHVLHLGSVSKTLAPAVRVGWAVVPPALRSEFVFTKLHDDLGTSALLQATLEALIADGGYERHLRRTRLTYRRRREALVAELAARLPEWEVTGVAAGLHIVVRLPSDLDSGAISRRLAARGVRAPALDDYARGTAGPPFPGLVLGYAALSPDRAREAVAEIAAASRVSAQPS